MKLNSILMDLNNNKKLGFLNAKKGKDFEDRIVSLLISKEYTRLPNDEFKNLKYFKEIKKAIINFNKEGIVKINNPELIEISNSPRLVYQPFGKQYSPDLLLIKKGSIVPIELKFTAKKVKNPVWNSGLPRQNYLYVFGSYELKDISFFSGSDLLTFEEEFEIKKLVNSEREKLKNNGLKILDTFEIYLRPMYNQKSNIWKNPKRENFQLHAINLFKDF
ncbi:MAG: hypothetical protein HPPSJP_1170 [Candidatus Hepatoplasma scabrum]|nr:MAG: hypothetical protein HPPSJP_1170 [Candidatus Hepatoplasma sp.]